jgi:hypothetical protein
MADDAVGTLTESMGVETDTKGTGRGDDGNV